jgi:hypothetical protein
MKRSIISLLVVALCGGTATAALAQNVTAGDNPAEASQGMTKDKEQKEMSPGKADQGGMTKPGKVDETTTPKDSMHDKGDAAFKAADKDNDGTLDRNEAKAMPNVAKNFDAIDTDKDGTVSLAEIHTYMKAQIDADKNQAAVKN